MAKRSLLGWFDQGNQRAMDYQRSQPDVGVKSLPYAKSDSARRAAIAIIVIVGAIAVFDWRAGLVALVLAIPLLWRLEHHFFFGHRDARVGDSTNESDEG